MQSLIGVKNSATIAYYGLGDARSRKGRKQHFVG
jgi:hypothetical protein